MPEPEHVPADVLSAVLSLVEDEDELVAAAGAGLAELAGWDATEAGALAALATAVAVSVAGAAVAGAAVDAGGGAPG